MLELADDKKQYQLPSNLATFRRYDDEPVAADLALVPGDRLDLYWHGYHLLAAVQEVDPDGVAYDRTSPRSSWTLFRTDQELAASVATRYPGVKFQSFETVERGVSGRVGKIRILAEEDATSEDFDKARKLVQKAERLIFLGCAYHEANMNRLGLEPPFGGQVRYGSHYHLKPEEVSYVYGRWHITCVGPTSAKSLDSLREMPRLS